MTTRPPEATPTPPSTPTHDASRRVALKAAAAAALAPVILPARAADRIKIGFINTFSGPGGGLGKHYRDAMDLWLESNGGRMGGLPAEIVYGDDQLKPEVGKQLADRMVERDRIDVLMGFNFSNVLMASVDTPFKAGIPVLSCNAGPAPLAGAGCNPLLFAVAFQNDGAAESTGAYMQQQRKTDSVFLLAPNYQAGKDMMGGFKRYFKGKIAGEVYPALNQLDFAAEIAQIGAAKPQAAFVFMPGGLGVNFVRQWAQSGVGAQVPLYSVFTVDHVTLKAIGDAAVGMQMGSHYVEDLPNAANRRFVEVFTKKHAYVPSEYAAQTWDAANLLDGAIRAVNGKIEDKPALLAALRRAPFTSVRGDFRFNTNQFPVQTYYLREVVKGPSGALGFVTRGAVLKDHPDPYVSQCPMKA